MKKKLQKLRGFTLVEVMLYVVISTTILGVTIMFLQIILQSRIKNMVIQEVEGTGLMISEQINREILAASGVNSPAFASNASNLNLAYDEAVDDPTLFDLSSGKIRITEGVASPIDLNSDRINVSNLNFYNLSNTDTGGIIRYEFTLEYNGIIDRNEYKYVKDFFGSQSLK